MIEDFGTRFRVRKTHGKWSDLPRIWEEHFQRMKTDPEYARQVQEEAERERRLDDIALDDCVKRWKIAKAQP